VDRNLLATGSHDGTINVWNISSRSVIVLEAHSSSVLALEWSPVDGSRLASGGHDSTVSVWDVNRQGDDRILLREQGHIGPVTALAWSAANVGKLASGGEDKSILIWSIGSRSFRVLVGHEGSLTSLMWRPQDETQIASAAADGTVRLWDLSQVSFAEVLAHNSSVSSVSYSSDGARIATGQTNGVVAVWKVGRGRTPTALEYRLRGHQRSVSHIVWDSTSHAPGVVDHSIVDRFASISVIGDVIGWHLPHDDGLRSAIPESFELTAVIPAEEGLSSPAGTSFVLGGVHWASHNSSHLSEAFVVRTSGTDEVCVWRLVESLLDTVTANLPDSATTIVGTTWARAECQGANLAISTGNGGIDVSPEQ
jgi:WD40 repeat protein